MSGQPGAETLGTPQEDALTKGTPIGAARRIAENPCIVKEDDDLRQVAEAISVHHRAHAVAVEDAAGTLVGIIPIRLLTDELFLQVAPEEFIQEIFDRDRLEEYGRMLRAGAARDLMLEPVFVTVEDTIGDAFARMHDHDLEGIPIVDAKRRPTGYLDRLELIKIWLLGHQAGDHSPSA